MAKNFKTKKLDRTNNGRMLAFFLGGMATALAIVSVGVFAQEAPGDEDEVTTIEIDVGTEFDPNYVTDSVINAINEALSGYAKSSDIEQQFTDLETQIGSTYATKDNLNEYVKTNVVNDLQTQVSNLSGQTNALSGQMSTLSDQMSTVVRNSELSGKIQDYINNNACSINSIITNGQCRPE